MNPRTIIGLAICAVITLAGSIGAYSRLHKVCESLEVSIANMGSNTVMSQASVEQLLKGSGVHPVGKLARDAKLAPIENALRQEIWFDRVERLSHNGSKCSLCISVKTPLVQLFAEDGSSCIITDRGEVMPASPDIHDKLIIANGHIPALPPAGTLADSLTTGAVRSIYLVAKAIRADEASAAQYSQIFVSEKNELQLYNNITRHRVLVGNGSNIGQKLENLQTAYAEGIIYTDREYTAIDARYDKRVYAVKNNTQL